MSLLYSSPMKLAKKLSFKSNSRVRIGSVLIKGKSVIGVGFNKIWKTHPLMSSRNPHKKLHAELDSILGIDRHLLIGSTIYVYRQLRDGTLGLCRPCVDCQAILKEAGVYKGYYTDPKENNFIGEILF